MPWKFNPFTGKLGEVGTSGNAVATQDIISDGNMSIMTYDGIMKYVNRTTIEPSSGNIITEGNITAVSFIGDGSQLTGLTGGGAGDRLTNGDNEVILGSTGTLTFPTLTVPISDNANPSGTGQTIKFSDTTQQAIIYGPESTSEAANAQRIIIQGAPGYAGTSGEGGDVYVWAGPGGDADGNGGDIKVRAGKGDGTGSGGYLNFQAGNSSGTGNGGYINIEGGESSTYGSGGNITVRAQSGGEITLRTRTSIGTNNDWQFDADGDLTAPRNIILNNPVTTVTTTTTGTVADSTANPFTFRILKADNPQLVIPFADPNFVLRWTGSDAGSLAAADQAPNGQGVSSLDSDDGTYWNFDSWFGLSISRPDTGTVFSVDYGVVVSDTTISTIDTNLIIEADGEQWKFGKDGKLTLPGALVKSTVAKTGATIPTTTGAVTNFDITPFDGSGNLTDDTYGPFTLDSVEFTVIVQSGYPVVFWLGTQPTLTIGDVIGTLDSGALGGTPGTTFTVTVSNVVQETPTAIGLTKSVNKLTDGEYTLANGVEGQIMYLVRQTGSTAHNVIVASARVDGTTYTDVSFTPFTDGTDPTNIATLIFTDSAWQSMGGVWNFT